MNISDKELEQAKNLINSFCIGEFGNATDFTKLSSVNIAYTTITDAEIPIQVTLDLERYYLMRTLDGHVIDKEEYDTFQDFYENCLEVLNFDDLVYVTDEQLQAFYGNLTYSLDNLAYNSDGTVDFDVVRDYAPNIPGKFTIYSDQSKGSEDEAQVLSLSGFTFSEDADRRKEEVKYINAHYTDIENTLVDLTKSRYMEHFLLRTKDKASTIEAGSLIKEAYNGIKLIRNSEDYKRWLNFYDGFHQYSFNNTMLIYMQNPSASLCAGFNTWKNKKRYVKAGEKGLKILAPITETVLREVPVLDDDGKPILDENGKEQTKKVKEKVFANKFYVTSTFDVSQTEGEPIPELSYSGTSEKVENYGALKKVLEEIAPFPVEYTDELQEGCDGRCSYTAEQIYVRNDMEEAKTVEVLIHEIGHAYMHDKTRFEEAKEHLKVISDRDSREIQAESLSYIVTHKLGLDTSGFSFPYIAAWSSNHTEQEVMNAMIYIRDEADAFYDLIEKKLELELNKSPQLNVEPALQTEETKPISNISDGDEVKMATGNLNYSTDQNTTHTENAELKEELNSELYNSMFEEQEHYRNWLLSLPPEEILFHAFSYSVREDILMTQEENNFSIEKCKALLKSPTPLADMKRAYDKTETNYMDDIRSIMENHANDVIEENKKKSSDRETTVSSVRDVADFAELFANDRISGAEKEKD
ncbi:MAG: DUF3848 domain-containing protein [Hominenteromicrobium sp.]|uniref:DUF3848 domain-containing protein n=1 Tax=Hominenteromicrobium sp. TaxID=3073581 RepID=UPI0039A01F3E